MTARTRIALVGAGSMGRNHARVVSANPSAELALVVDPFENNGRATAQQYGATWVPDLSSAHDVDGVIVAASTEYHYDLATQILRAGLPLLVEKPVCPSLAQTEEILAAAAEADIPIMCGFLERYNPAIVVAQKMIDEPLYVRSQRHSPYAPRIKTGVAWDLLVHDVDLITRLHGGRDPEAIHVDVAQFHPSSAPGAEDVVDVALRFDGGMIATASASRIGQRKTRSMIVQGLDQMVEIDLLRREVTLYRHSTVSEMGDASAGFRQTTEMEVPEVFGKEPLVAQFDHFLDLIAGRADADAERRAILPAHRIVDQALRTTSVDISAF